MSKLENLLDELRNDISLDEVWTDSARELAAKARAEKNPKKRADLNREIYKRKKEIKRKARAMGYKLKRSGMLKRKPSQERHSGASE